jgi:hypothetical protein
VDRIEIDQAPSRDPIGKLITELGRAAHAGWGPTTRLMMLVVVVAGAVALVLAVSR